MSEARNPFTALLAGTPAQRLPWVPVAEPIAARMTGTDPAAMTADAGSWTAGLLQSAELLQADAVIAGFHWTLTAQACGATIDGDVPGPAAATPPESVVADPLAAPRQAALIDVLARLRTGARGRYAIVAALVGPCTLGAQLAPAAPAEERLKRIKAGHTAIVEAVLKTRPDLMLFLEHGWSRWPEAGRGLPRAYATLRNLCNHYAVPVGIYAEKWRAADLGDLAALAPAVLVLGRGDGDPVAALGALPSNLVIGVPVPILDDATRPAALAALGVARAHGRGVFASTAGPLAADADLGALRTAVGALRAAA